MTYVSGIVVVALGEIPGYILEDRTIHLIKETSAID
jgi:hypothetical protein